MVLHMDIVGPGKLVLDSIVTTQSLRQQSVDRLRIAAGRFGETLEIRQPARLHRGAHDARRCGVDDDEQNVNARGVHGA